MMNVLFICTGNTCRSPMAEGYFKKLCIDKGRNDIVVSSAGTYAMEGIPPSESAIAVLKDYCVDISSLRSSHLSYEQLEAADLIVVMTENHYHQVLTLDPAAFSKVKMLLEFKAGKKENVNDPYGGSKSVYSYCFEEMKIALENLFNHIDKFKKKSV